MENKLYGDEVKNLALRKNMELLGKPLIHPGGPRRILPAQMLRYAAHLRDIQIHKMPILPGAVQVFQQLSSGREWQVVGKLRSAVRAVEWLNNAKTLDIVSGLPNYGFEDFLKRRSLDFVTVGRTTFAVNRRNDTDIGALEYLDPTILQFTRKDKKSFEVKPTEKVWDYLDGRKFKSQDVFLNHTLPMGGSGAFISPLASIMPTAILAWLIREHDTASTDGRRIRDIIIVGSDDLANSVEEAILAQIAIATGENPNTVGIPLIQFNNLTDGPVSDQIATLGLSKIPEEFDREEFTFQYVNQIAAALGLSLRHFWNSERTTNRALEEIQEQRQLQKGPSSFVRSEERQINQSGILKPFGNGRSRVHFNFIEEVDTSSALANAQVLKMTTEALEKVALVFQAGLSLDALLAWMQSIRVLPSDLELITAPGTLGQEVEESPDGVPVPQPNEQIISNQSPPKGTSSSEPTKSVNVPDYDEFAVDMNGKITERRAKVYSVRKALYVEALMEVIPQPVETEAALNSAIETLQLNNRTKVKTFFELKEGLVAEYIEALPLYAPDQIKTAINKVISDQPLDTNEQTIVDFLSDQVS